MSDHPTWGGKRPNTGGARPGAGRKPQHPPRRQLSVHLPPALVEVPDHPNAHPHLMLPDGDAWEPEIKPAPPKFEPPIIAVDHNIHGVKKLLKALGLKPLSGGRHTDVTYNVFRDEYYGICVQVPDNYKDHVVMTLHANGFTFARRGEGFYVGNIYC